MDGDSAFLATTAAQLRGLDAMTQVPNDFAMQCDLVDDDLQTIVLRWIMAASHHDPGASGAEGVGGVIQLRR